MRTKQIVKGLKNSQKIRVILNGIGFVTTVEGVESMPFAYHRIAVITSLEIIVQDKITGFASQQRVYSENSRSEKVDCQVDLI